MSEPRDTGSDEARALEQSRILKEKIARAQGNRVAENGETRTAATTDMTPMGRALRLGTEFIAAILVGAVAGYLLDQWLHTRPWIMLVLLLVGFAAGVLNVTRSAAALNQASPPPPDAPVVPDDDEDDH